MENLNNDKRKEVKRSEKTYIDPYSLLLRYLYSWKKETERKM